MTIAIQVDAPERGHVNVKQKYLKNRLYSGQGTRRLLRHTQTPAPLSTKGENNLNKKKLEILEEVIQDAINEALEETEYTELTCDKVEIGTWFFSDDYYGSIRIKIHD